MLVEHSFDRIWAVGPSDRYTVKFIGKSDPEPDTGQVGLSSKVEFDGDTSPFGPRCVPHIAQKGVAVVGLVHRSVSARNKSP